MIRNGLINYTGDLISLCIDHQASLQPEDGEGKPQQKQARASAKKRTVKYKSQKQAQPSGGNGSQWSVKQIAGLLGVFCVIALCVTVVQRRNGSNEGNSS